MNVIHRTASAHRTPNLVLNILNDYKDSEDVVAIITVAGLSDALSGMVAANSTKPVIAFPPDLGKYGDAKVFSSTKLPGGVKVSLARNNEELLNLIKEKSLQAVYSPPEISGRRLKIVETYMTDNQERGVALPLGLPLFGKGKVRDIYEVNEDK